MSGILNEMGPDTKDDPGPQHDSSTPVSEHVGDVLVSNSTRESDNPAQDQASQSAKVLVP